MGPVPKYMGVGISHDIGIPGSPTPPTLHHSQNARTRERIDCPLREPPAQGVEQRGLVQVR